MIIKYPAEIKAGSNRSKKPVIMTMMPDAADKYNPIRLNKKSEPKSIVEKSIYLDV